MGESISGERPSEPRAGGGLSVWVTVVLTISAALALGYWAVRGLDEWDTEALESPLMLSVARQLLASPAELYGPFDGQNPLVLIHAPLYYRLAGLSAWPLSRAGLHPVTAARVAGRSLSALGLLSALSAAYRLARLDGLSRRSGWWAVLLIAASPMLSGQPVAVRPDMIGVALQTAGVLLVLLALRQPSRAGSRVAWAFAAFGLAACVKQHLIVSAVVSTVLLLEGWRKGMIRFVTIARGLAVWLAIVLVDYGVEWVITTGRVWDAAFVAAGNVGRVHPGGWDHVGVVMAGLLNRAIGPISLLAGTGLVVAGASRRIGGMILLAAGLGLAGLVQTAQVLNHISQNSLSGALVAVGGALLFVMVFPLCALIGRSGLLGNRLDAALWVYAAAEIALAVVLFEMSTGAWMNYAIQAVVFGSILAARVASRVLGVVTSPRLRWPIAFAVLSVPVATFNEVFESHILLRRDRDALNVILEHRRFPPSSFYFVDKPGVNRVNGRLDLVYDDWLYPVFESMHLAEGRTGWLGQALRSRSLRAVVATSPESRIPGTELELNRLGFHSDIEVGPYFVWTR
jgi:hypothetical protein